MKLTECFYRHDATPEIGIFDDYCLIVHTVEKDGTQTCRSCDDVKMEGKCPQSLSAKERGILKKSLKRYDKVLKELGK